jgi:hypothetical protein
MEILSKMIIYGLVKRFQDKGCVQHRKYVQHLTVLTEETLHILEETPE